MGQEQNRTGDRGLGTPNLVKHFGQLYTCPPFFKFLTSEQISFFIIALLLTKSWTRWKWAKHLIHRVTLQVAHTILDLNLIFAAQWWSWQRESLFVASIGRCILLILRRSLSLPVNGWRLASVTLWQRVSFFSSDWMYNDLLAPILVLTIDSVEELECDLGLRRCFFSDFFPQYSSGFSHASATCRWNS